MPQLLLLRHAKSDRTADTADDRERPLTPRGRKAARRIGDELARRGLAPDHVIVSPARRARSTWRRTAPRLGLDPDEAAMDERLYDASARDLLAVLEGVPAGSLRALLVGHQPSLEDLVALLNGRPLDPPPRGKTFPTATVALLEFDGDWTALCPGAARLVEIIRPRDA